MTISDISISTFISLSLKNVSFIALSNADKFSSEKLFSLKGANNKLLEWQKFIVVFFSSLFLEFLGFCKKVLSNIGISIRFLSDSRF